jgi:hypothetical protein
MLGVSITRRSFTDIASRMHWPVVQPIGFPEPLGLPKTRDGLGDVGKSHTFDSTKPLRVTHLGAH